MILAVTFILLSIYIIKKSSFFKDEKLSFKFLIIVFILKISGVLLYVSIYSVNASAYTFNSDTQSILHDAQIIYQSLFTKPKDFFQIIFGFHNNTTTGYLYENYFSKMDKWFSIGKSDFLLNDNQSITKLNALLMILSFGKFYAHALLNCILSFLGSFFIFKTFRNFFKGKEQPLLILLLFIPSVYFWSSGVLKEPFVIFFLGGFLCSFFHLFIYNKILTSKIILFVFSVFGLLILKPYILVSILFPLITFSLIETGKIKKVTFGYFMIIISGVSVCILFSFFILNKNVFSIIAKRQNDFVSIGKGGTFLYGNGNYLRIDFNEFNKSLNLDNTSQLYRVKAGCNYMYWNYPNFKDTLFVKNNTDTLTLYELKSSITPSNSLIESRLLEPTFKSYFELSPNAIINSFFYPFFYKCKTLLQLYASLENLIFLIFLMCSVLFLNKNEINKNLLCFFISSVIILFVLAGYSTAIGGALVRYKMPFLPFLWMIPLLIIDTKKLNRITTILKEIFIPRDIPTN
jgi:hypothetical protein